MEGVTRWKERTPYNPENQSLGLARPNTPLQITASSRRRVWICTSLAHTLGAICCTLVQPMMAGSVWKRESHLPRLRLCLRPIQARPACASCASIQQPILKRQFSLCCYQQSRQSHLKPNRIECSQIKVKEELERECGIAKVCVNVENPHVQYEGHFGNMWRSKGRGISCQL